MSHAPPPKPPKPGQVTVVRALFDYESNAEDELSFEQDDYLYIIDKSSSKDWWRARCGDKIGLIPSNYVEGQTETVHVPMHNAAQNGNLAFLLELIENQVSVNSLNSAGETPLHNAARGGHMDCIDALIIARCQVNVQNKNGDTPLHLAAYRNREAAVERLLAAGAKCNIRNNDDRLAYDLAHSASCQAMIKSHMRLSTRVVSQGDYGEDDEEDSD